MSLINKEILMACFLALATACSSEVVSSQFLVKRSPRSKKPLPSDDPRNRKVTELDLPEITSEIQAFALAARDVRDETNPVDIRYLSIAHQKASGVSAEDLKAVEHAVGKLFNSLSWQPQITAVRSIDSLGLLFKIKLSEFGWDANLWNILASGHPASPDSIPGVNELQRFTGSDKPLLRADWVMRSASQPPLYYKLIRVPSNVTDLLKGLNISAQANINAGRVIRAGFERSAVSTNHRVIERHDLAKGFLWRSYEFRNKNGNRNIFDFPLGPAANSGGISILNGVLPPSGNANNGSGPLFPGQAFVSDGSEIYFTLPNGMLGFYIAGAEGLRINEVPGTDEKKIVAGISCFSCHSKGTMPARDEVAKRTRVTGAALDAVRRIYSSDEVLEATLKSDSQFYLNALSQIGISADGVEPINAVVRMQ